MSLDSLNYVGTAWSLARVTGSAPLEMESQLRIAVVSPPRPRAVSAGPPRPRAVTPMGAARAVTPMKCLVFRIAAVGPGRPWQTDRPQAFWRSYSEFVPSTDVNQGEREAAFVRRFGPVNEPKTESGELVTYTGHTAQRFLQEVARAWEPEDASGLSHVSIDPKRRDYARHVLSRFILPVIMVDTDVAVDFELRPSIQVRSLYAFMAWSAASQLRRQASMRRCKQCQTWFEPPRVDAFYCSNACRRAHHVDAHSRVSVRSRKKGRAHG